MSELFREYYGLLEQRMEYIKEIKILLEAQLDLIDCDDFIGLEKLFNDSNEKMRECDAIREKLSQINIEDINEENHGQIKNMNDSTKMMLDEIILINNSLREKAQKKLEDYRKNIKEINGAKKGLNSYGAVERHVDSFYFDQKN